MTVVKAAEVKVAMPAAMVAVMVAIGASVAVVAAALGLEAFGRPARATARDWTLERAQIAYCSLVTGRRTGLAGAVSCSGPGPFRLLAAAT